MITSIGSEDARQGHLAGFGVPRARLASLASLPKVKRKVRSNGCAPTSPRRSEMNTVVDTLEELTPLVGKCLGSSSWVEVDQQRIDAFADATEDHQWIHVDADRAKSGPFGTTIAQGCLTLSLLISMWTEILEVRDVGITINYGLGKVRFPAPVPVGSKIRATATLATLEAFTGGMQATIDSLIERDGSDKPVCVAQLILRFYR
jgi:acyl dehydratase